MTLYDEPDDAATKHDVEESRVFGRIRYCVRPADASRPASMRSGAFEGPTI